MLIEAKQQSKNNSLSSDSRYWFSLKNKIVKLPGKKLFFFEHILLLGHFTGGKKKKKENRRKNFTSSVYRERCSLLKEANKYILLCGRIREKQGPCDVCSQFVKPGGNSYSLNVSTPGILISPNTQQIL